MASSADEQIVVERNYENEIVALTMSSKYAGPWTVRLYDTVMLEASDDYKFLGYIREFIDTDTDGDDNEDGDKEEEEEEDEKVKDEKEKDDEEEVEKEEDEEEEEDEGGVKLRICWFYRANDVLSRLKGKSQKLQKKDLIVCKAEHSLEDVGLMKELFLSSHMDDVSCHSLMHPVRVWFLKGTSLDPVIVRQDGEGGGAAVSAGSSGSGGHVELLPGFICRRYFDVESLATVPLSKLKMCAKPKIPDWVIEDFDKLTSLSTTKRKAFKAEWTRRCAAKGETGALRREAAKAGGTSGAE